MFKNNIMKKKVLSVLIVGLSMLLFSCSNTENFMFSEMDLENEETEKSLGIIDIPLGSDKGNIDTDKYQYSYLGSDKQITQGGLRAPATVETWTVFGSDQSVLTESNLRMYVSGADAAKFGVPPGTYFYDIYSCKKIITLNSNQLYATADSPECGMTPGMNSKRGYAASQTGNTVTMTTEIGIITYDIIGRTYNVWWPKTPLGIKWIYNIIIL